MTDDSIGLTLAQIFSSAAEEIDGTRMKRWNKKEVCDEYEVSTVILSLNHGTEEDPLWYETMIFAHDGEQVSSYTDLYYRRYATQEEAERGHEETVEALKSGTLELGKERLGW